jgi:hypothetical protein
MRYLEHGGTPLAFGPLVAERKINNAFRTRSEGLLQTVSTVVALTTLTTQLERNAMKTSHTALAIALGAAILGGVSIAGSMKDASFKGAAPADQWLTIPAIYEKVADAGYTAITEIEREDNGYDVEATNPGGERVDLRVDPVTGEVLDSRIDK